MAKEPVQVQTPPAAPPADNADGAGLDQQNPPAPPAPPEPPAPPAAPKLRVVVLNQTVALGNGHRERGTVIGTGKPAGNWIDMATFKPADGLLEIEITTAFNNLHLLSFE